MDYLSTKQASEKWGVTQTRITVLAKSGRIPGAKLIGKSWIIPKDAEKPSDKRFSKSEEVPKRDGRLHVLVNREEEDFFPPLSAEEKLLRDAEKAFLECSFEHCDEYLTELLARKISLPVKIYALFYRCLNCLLIGKFQEVLPAYNQFQRCFLENFPQKSELLYLIDELNADLAFTHRFSGAYLPQTDDIDEPELIPTLQAQAMYGYYLREDTEDGCVLIAFYLTAVCTLQNGHYIESQSMFLTLMCLYAKLGNHAKAVQNLRMALDIAQEHDLYASCAGYYYYFPDILSEALKTYPEDFVKKINALSDLFHNRFTSFFKQTPVENYLAKITQDEYRLILYALQHYPNKYIADLMGISTVTVNNRYNALYKKLRVPGKPELLALVTTAPGAL